MIPHCLEWYCKLVLRARLSNPAVRYPVLTLAQYALDHNRTYVLCQMLTSTTVQRLLLAYYCLLSQNELLVSGLLFSLRGYVYSDSCNVVNIYVVTKKVFVKVVCV